MLGFAALCEVPLSSLPVVGGAVTRSHAQVIG